MTQEEIFNQIDDLHGKRNVNILLRESSLERVNEIQQKMKGATLEELCRLKAEGEAIFKEIESLQREGEEHQRKSKSLFKMLEAF